MRTAVIMQMVSIVGMMIAFFSASLIPLVFFGFKLLWWQNIEHREAL